VADASSCTVSPDINSTQSTVIINLRPTPQEIIGSLSGGLASPLALWEKFESYAGVANTVMALVTRAFNTVFAFIPGNKLVAPSCKWYVTSNSLVCTNVNKDVAKMLCTLTAVTDVVGNITKAIVIAIPSLDQTQSLDCEGDVDDRPWGLNQINVTGAWNAGYNGQGVIVANIDSGVRGTHVEIAHNRRPFYSWFDPYTNSNDPIDQNGHGTHTMANMVGRTVGVAPGAQWIACRGCSSSTCDNEQLLACGDFMACPDGKAQNCSTIPDVINCSWGAGIGNTFYDGVLAYWKALNIKYFYSAGNSGSACATVMSPADSNWTMTGLMSVGAVDCTEKTASYSSNGPSQRADYMGGLGIQIVGPGSNVRSAWNTNDTAYNTISGTSMSSPAVAGVAALVLSKHPKMAARDVYAILTDSAYRDPAIQAANGLSTCNVTQVGTGYPNNKYGYGRADAGRAILL
jgi:subtilisin family serine protease